MSYHHSSAFLSPEILIRQAAFPWELKGAAALRQQVFVTEQKIFCDHDKDEIDAFAHTLVAISTLASEADQVVGTVRIHEESSGVWRGSRLAVDRRYRRVAALGTELIRLAVCSAQGFGCSQFLAHVQMQNVPLFTRLSWQALTPVDVHGAAHMEMQADLGAYSPVTDPVLGWKKLTLQKRAVL